MKKTEGICEMCGHSVGIRQRAHIAAEADASKANTLMLCPTCHVVFDTELKPRLYAALVRYGAKNLPASWGSSIYEQAAEASKHSKGRRKQ